MFCCVGCAILDYYGHDNIICVYFYICYTVWNAKLCDARNNCNGHPGIGANEQVVVVDVDDDFILFIDDGHA